MFSDFKILFRRCPGFLVEGVKDIDCLHAPRHVNHTISAARFEDANLFHTLADGGHRLEIVGLAAALDLIELITRVMPRVVGEVSQALQRIAKKAHGSHKLYYIQLDIAKGRSSLVSYKMSLEGVPVSHTR